MYKFLAIKPLQVIEGTKEFFVYSQNLSFLKKKPTWFVFSDLLTGLLYLQKHFKISKLIKYEVDNLLLLEDLPDFLLGLFSSLLAGHLLLAHDALEVNISGNNVSSWQQVVVVDGLDEWLHLGLSLNLLSAHSLGHLQWVPLNACN